MPASGLVSGSDIGVDLALKLLGHMRSEGERMKLVFSGVVTDRAGHIVAASRMDGAPLGAMPIAIDKAYTAALWETTTGSMAEPSNPGNGDFGFAGTLGTRMIVFAGGVPIHADGAIVGALGISGALSSEDEACAFAALAAAGLRSPLAP